MESEKKPHTASNEPTDTVDGIEDDSAEDTSTDNTAVDEEADADDDRPTTALMTVPSDSVDTPNTKDSTSVVDDVDVSEGESTPKEVKDGASQAVDDKPADEPKVINPEDVAAVLGASSEDAHEEVDQPDDDSSEEDDDSDLPVGMGDINARPADEIEDDADSNAALGLTGSSASESEPKTNNADAKEDNLDAASTTSFETKKGMNVPAVPATTDSTSTSGMDSTNDGSTMLGSGAVVVSTPKKRKKSVLVGIIIVVIVVVLLGAVAAAYYMAMNKPQNVLNDALVNSFNGKVTSATFDGSVTTSGYNTTFSGGASQNGTFTLTGSAHTGVGIVGYDLLSPDGTTYYARLSGVSNVSKILSTGKYSPLVQLYIPVLNGINNQWIQISQSMVQGLTGSSVSVNSKPSSSDVSQLGTYYKQHNFLTVQKSLPDQVVAGKNSYQYQVTIDKAKLEAFLADSKNIKDLNITQSDLSSLENAMSSSNFSTGTATIWVTKSDHLIDQIAFSTTTTTSRITIDSTNIPVSVTTPTAAKTLTTVISEFLKNTNLSSGISL